MSKGYLYLAGKMRGLPGLGFANFDQAQKVLEAAGYQICSPAELDRDVGYEPHRDGDPSPEFTSNALRRDVRALSHCDAIVMLPGWETSDGAKMEMHVAQTIGMPVYEMHDLARAELTVVAEAPPVMTFPIPPSWRSIPPEEQIAAVSDGFVRTFGTGATRDRDEFKPDYEGFLSPLAIRAYGRYMHKHRQQKDGTLRDSDNWQKGFPLDSLMSSMWRHFLDVWTIHDGFDCFDYEGNPVDMQDALSGVMFNVVAYLHEVGKVALHDDLGKPCD